MISYAVIGNPIDHSLSPLIHQYFAKQFDLVFDYGKILANRETFEEQVDAFFQAGGRGLNITSPFKLQAFAISDEVTSRCVEAGAANTLWQQHGKIMADTTDGSGLIRDLMRYIKPEGQRLLILGAGGVVQSILGPLLEKAPASITLSNRTLAKATALQQAFNNKGLIEVAAFEMLHQSFDIVIYAIKEAEHAQNLPVKLFSEVKLAYDLTYHPSGITPFVRLAQACGCRAIDGFGMLVCQAAESFRIWHGQMPEFSDLLERRHLLLS